MTDQAQELQGVPAELVEAHEKPITFAEIFDLLLCQAQHGEAMQAALVREGMRKAPDPTKLREAKVYAAAATLIGRVMDDPAMRARLAEIARELREAAADQGDKT